MADGVIAFLGDLGVDPSDAVTLVIACHMGAETVGEFTQEEFMRGMRSMGAGSVEARPRPAPPRPAMPRPATPRNATQRSAVQRSATQRPAWRRRSVQPPTHHHACAAGAEGEARGAQGVARGPGAAEGGLHLCVRLHVPAGPEVPPAGGVVRPVGVTPGGPVPAPRQVALVCPRPPRPRHQQGHVDPVPRVHPLGQARLVQLRRRRGRLALPHRRVRRARPEGRVAGACPRLPAGSVEAPGGGEQCAWGPPRPGRAP